METQAADLYRHRFDAGERGRKAALWTILVRRFLQRFVPPEAVLLDLGAGLCEGINAFRARTRLALEPDLEHLRHAAGGVRPLSADAVRPLPLRDASVDSVLASNVFEHFPDKAALSRCLAELHRVLRPGGALLVIQPNIRYTGGAYWDFYDHHLPLTERSLEEALALAGFAVEKTIPRFLPYTTKTRIALPAAALRLYLSVPLLWRFFGQQSFILARRA